MINYDFVEAYTIVHVYSHALIASFEEETKKQTNSLRNFHVFIATITAQH
jgi:hypothetical protein